MLCCGDKNHRRTDCPLRYQCLICDKEGHVFKDSYLAKPPKINHLRDILCIHDEEQNEDSLNDAYHDGIRKRIKKLVSTPCTYLVGGVESISNIENRDRQIEEELNNGDR